MRILDDVLRNKYRQRLIGMDDEIESRESNLSKWWRRQIIDSYGTKENLHIAVAKVNECKKLCFIT